MSVSASADGGLGFVRSYLTSIGGGRQGLSKAYLPELDSVFASPRLWRFFCSEGPKRRNYEIYYPKNKKEIPKGNNQKAESGEGIMVTKLLKRSRASGIVHVYQ